jgi:hypothetical protein
MKGEMITAHRDQASSGRHRACSRRCALLAALALAVVGVALMGVQSAMAGVFMQVVCGNPDGSQAPVDGWASFEWGTVHSPTEGAIDDCGHGGLRVEISGGNAEPVGANATWTYTAPAGSSIAGGDALLSLTASSGGIAWLGSSSAPAPGNVIAACGAFNNYNGCMTGDRPLALPGPGKQLVLGAQCIAPSDSGRCSTLDIGTLSRARILLANAARPAASGFAGSLLAPSPHGTANISFTASDPVGPGIYWVTVLIDGGVAYQGTPDTNGGACASIGTDPMSGALMFEHEQPCPQTEDVDIPVDTSKLADRQHEVTVLVEDAARNTSTVLDQIITTANRTTVAATGGEQPQSAAASQIAYTLRFQPRSQKLLAGAVLRRRYDRSALTLSGTVLGLGGQPAPGVPVIAQATAPGGAPVTVARTTSDGAGRFRLTIPRGDSRSLRISAGAAAVALEQLVAPDLRMRVKALPGARLLFTGRVRIGWRGSPRPTVEIEDRAPSGWQPLAFVTVGRDGTFRKVYKSSPLTVGYQFAFRASTQRTGRWQAATTPSTTARVTG